MKTISEETIFYFRFTKRSSPAHCEDIASVVEPDFFENNVLSSVLIKFSIHVNNTTFGVPEKSKAIIPELHLLFFFAMLENYAKKKREIISENKITTLFRGKRLQHQQ